MTKRDFRTRRDLFRKGQIERFKDFKKFERQYIVRRRADRNRTVAIVIAIVLLTAALFFGAFAKPAHHVNSHPEQRVEINVNSL
ncbi:MAG: hypothetical protein JXQ90_08780 [Cyclobacteriaceae bacterium]